MDIGRWAQSQAEIEEEGPSSAPLLLHPFAIAYILTE